MKEVRTVLRVALFASIVLWTVGFLLGPDAGLTWMLASLSAYVGPASAVLLITMMITGMGATQRERRKKAGETLKCVECGRPSVPGSRYCRYHMDIMKDEEELGSR